LKTDSEYNIKRLKCRDLQIVCSQLKVRAVKNSMKEQMIRKLVCLHQVKARYDKITETPKHVQTRKELQCPCRLLNILFTYAFAEGFSQLGNVAAHADFIWEKQPTISYFGKVFKKLTSGKMQQTTIYILKMTSL